MRTLILLSLLSCAACVPQTEFVAVQIPRDLLTPVADPAPDVPTTVNGLATGYIARGAALEDANSRIVAVAEIVEGPR